MDEFCWSNCFPVKTISMIKISTLNNEKLSENSQKVKIEQEKFCTNQSDFYKWKEEKEVKKKNILLCNTVKCKIWEVWKRQHFSCNLS
jgi:hypothetical protein